VEQGQNDNKKDGTRSTRLASQGSGRSRTRNLQLPRRLTLPAGDDTVPPDIEVTVTAMSPCLFCRIVSGEIPARLVHGDERYMAFADVNPQAPTHILVIPRRHLSGLNDLTADDESLAGGALLLIRELAAEHGLSDSGYRVVLNSGADAGQSVPHIHFHLLGGRELAWPPG
jgi:histidine triad (HIT) family protein